MKNSVELITELIEPTVSALELELWGVELVKHDRELLLRVYIEHENGITVDDCAKVSRQVSSLLDVEDPVAGDYTLEVSSPGTDRPLFTIAQFQHYIGEIANLRLRSPIDGRRKFKGEILKVEGDNISLQVDREVFVLPHSAVEKANIVFQY